MFSIFGGFESRAYKRSATTFSSPGIIWYGTMPSELAMFSGRVPLALATTMRGSVSSTILLTSCPVMPSFAPSHWIDSCGVRFERSAEGWLIFAVTPSTRVTLVAM